MDMEITGKGDFREAEFSLVHLQRTSWTCHSSTVQIYRAFSCRSGGGRGQLEVRIVRTGGYLYCPYGQLTGLVNFMVTLFSLFIRSFTKSTGHCYVADTVADTADKL